MAHESKYRREDLPDITVIYPDDGAPTIPQSCYAFGSRKHIDLCRDVNEISQHVYSTLLNNAGPNCTIPLLSVSHIVDELLCDVGYVRISTERI